MHTKGSKINIFGRSLVVLTGMGNQVKVKIFFNFLTEYNDEMEINAKLF